MSNSVMWDDSTKSWLVPKGTVGLTWMFDHSINSIIRKEIIYKGIDAVAGLHHKYCHIIKTTFDYKYSGCRISPHTTHTHLWVRKYDRYGNEWYLVIEK